MKKVRVRFKKIYTRLDPGMVIDSAIISYSEEAWIKEPEYTTLRHILYIDLYLAIFRFEWETKKPLFADDINFGI